MDILGIDCECETGTILHIHRLSYTRLLPLYRICFAKWGSSIPSASGFRLDEYAATGEMSEYALVQHVTKILQQDLISAEDVQATRDLARNVSKLRLLNLEGEPAPLTLAHLVAKYGLNAPQIVEVIDRQFSFNHLNCEGETPLQLIIKYFGTGIYYKNKEMKLVDALADEKKRGEDTFRKSLLMIIKSTRLTHSQDKAKRGFAMNELERYLSTENVDEEIFKMMFSAVKLDPDQLASLISFALRYSEGEIFQVVDIKY